LRVASPCCVWRNASFLSATFGPVFAKAPCLHEALEQMTPHRLPAVFLLIGALLACGARARVVATNPGLALAPTCANAVPVYADSEHVPYDYYEVALITAEGNSVYNGNGDLLKSIRNQAARLGANGVVIDALGATHATVKVVGAALGSNDAERKGRAIAIWMPSDTARVREACGARSQ
jgi:hypothetical protein